MHLRNRRGQHNIKIMCTHQTENWERPMIIIHSKTDWLKQPRNWLNLTNVVGRYVSNHSIPSQESRIL